MRFVKFSCLVLCIAVLFTSCQTSAGSNSASSYDPFAQVDEQPEGENVVGYSIDSYDEAIDFEGDKANYNFIITADGYDCDYGILLFVDGVCTAFNLDGGEDAYMQMIELEDKEQRSVTLSFVPTTGKSGDVLNAYVILTAWLDRVPTFKEGDASFGFADYPGSLVFTVNMKAPSKATEYKFKDCTDTTPLTDENRTLLRLEENAYSKAERDYYFEQQALPVADRDPSANLRQNKVFGYSEQTWVTNINIDKNKPFNFYISAVGAHHFKYNVTVFVNNKPIKSIDGYDGMTIEVDIEKYSFASMQYDLSEYSDTAVVYAVAVPVTEREDDYAVPFCEKTSSLGVILN